MVGIVVSALMDSALTFTKGTLMDYTIVELPERHIVGPTIRTANDAPDSGEKIGGLWQTFMGSGMDKSIPEPVLDPYTCYGLYYDYNMEAGDYAMMVGCESTATSAPTGMEELVIPAGRYAKYTVHGSVVDAVIEAWNAIWADEALTAQRAFTVDFEAYLPGDDQNHADIDIYVALR